MIFQHTSILPINLTFVPHKIVLFFLKNISFHSSFHIINVAIKQIFLALDSMLTRVTEWRHVFYFWKFWFPPYNCTPQAYTLINKVTQSCIIMLLVIMNSSVVRVPLPVWCAARKVKKLPEIILDYTFLLIIMNAHEIPIYKFLTTSNSTKQPTLHILFSFVYLLTTIF